MKKAKEYAEEILKTYVEKNEEAALFLAAQIVKELFKEANELEKARGVTRYVPMLAILKELHLKWESICRRVNKEVDLLNKRAFLDVIEAEMTMIYPNLIKIMSG